jgi:hypothetical protein
MQKLTGNLLTFIERRALRTLLLTLPEETPDRPMVVRGASQPIVADYRNTATSLRLQQQKKNVVNL